MSRYPFFSVVFIYFFIFNRSAKALSIDNRKDSGGKTELTKVKNIPMCIYIYISILCVCVSYNIYMQTRQRLFAKRDELDAPSGIYPPISFQTEHYKTNISNIAVTNFVVHDVCTLHDICLYQKMCISVNV